MATFKSPLSIYVLWHPQYRDGENLAKRLFTKLSRDVGDPFARSIGIPVYYRSKPFQEGSMKPAPIQLEESTFNAIVVLVDQQMKVSDDWKQYIAELNGAMAENPDQTRVFPMVTTPKQFGLAELGATNGVRLYEALDANYGMGDKNAKGESEVPDSANSAELEKLKQELGLKEEEIKELALELGKVIKELEEAKIELENCGGIDDGDAQAKVAQLVKANKKLKSQLAASTKRDESDFSFEVDKSSAKGGGININITINNADPNDITFMEAATSSGPEISEKVPDIKKMGDMMLSKFTQELCRLIISPPTETDSGIKKSGASVNLFLSHAKADGVEITTAIKEYIERDSAMKTFFDANDIAPGFGFDTEIKASIENSALICVQTDYYATREWCLFEVINAKRFDKSLVVLNAIKDREPRSFPYIGNVPTMRWDPNNPFRERDIVDLAMLEVLDNTYKKLYGEALQAMYTINNVHPIGHAPEMFTILRIREKIKEEGSDLDDPIYILYPDPPLGSEEISVLQDLAPEMEFITPTMLPMIEFKK